MEERSNVTAREENVRREPQTGYSSPTRQFTSKAACPDKDDKNAKIEPARDDLCPSGRDESMAAHQSDGKGANTKPAKESLVSPGRVANPKPSGYEADALPLSHTDPAGHAILGPEKQISVKEPKVKAQHRKRALEHLSGDQTEVRDDQMEHGRRAVMKGGVIDDEAFPSEDFKNKSSKDDQKSKAEKDGWSFRRVISSISATLGFNTHVDRSSVTVNSFQQVMEENFACTDIEVLQPHNPRGQYVTGVRIVWKLPARKKFSVCNVKVDIYNNSKGIFSQVLNSSATECVIPTKTLKCACLFNISVTCTVTVNGEEISSSTTAKFYTKPSCPKQLDVTITKKQLHLEWSVCKGADGYDVYIKEKGGAEYAKYKPAKDCKCKIDIDQKKIKLGRYYSWYVVAKKEDLENPSDDESVFVGKSRSPREVHAKKMDGLNIVMLTWKAPEEPTDKYTVEVAPKEGRNRILEVTNAFEKKIEDLKDGTTYTFFVTALYPDGQSPKSVSNSIKTKACTIVVEKLRVKKNEEEPFSALDCSWEQTSGAVGYKINIRTIDRSVTVTLKKAFERYTVRELQPNTEYAIAIAAQEPNGYGPYSERKTCKTDPGKVSSVVLVQQEDQIIITFRRAVGATEHRVTLQGDQVKFEKKLDEIVEVRFYNVLPDTSYQVSISAKNNEEFGPPVNAYIVTVPAAPKHSEIRIIPDSEKPWGVFAVSVQRSASYDEYEVKVTCSSDRSDVSTASMEFANNKEAVFVHHCFNKGVPYRVKVRARNQGGFGEWSTEQVAITAPGKIDQLHARLEDDKICADWKKVPHAEDYVVNLYEKEGDEPLIKTFSTSKHLFDDFVPQRGAKYYCVVAARNRSGDGKIKYSNEVFVPLDPPHKLSVTEISSHLEFWWRPSYGMRAAEITFWSSDMRIAEYTNEKSWKSPPVRHGQVYEFRIRAVNGKYASDRQASKTYITAPSAVLLKRHETKPETCLAVEIETQYDGPFHVYCGDKNEPFFSPARNLILENLKPATEYTISAACLNEPEESSLPCYSRRAMTIPAKVTGVTCSQLSPGCKRLSWVNCGNNEVEYAILLSRNNVFLDPLTTYNTTYDLPHLEYGSYAFKVSAGGGKKSDVCNVYVPERPAITVDVLSPKVVRILCREVEFADTYVMTISEGGAEFLKKTETEDGRFWIEKEFVPGKQYLVEVRSLSGEFLSDAATEHFIADLNPPSDLRYLLNETSPTTTAYFEWSPTENMAQSRVEISDASGQIISTAETLDCKWSYDKLRANQRYVFKVFPGDREKIFCHPAEKEFVTAPSAPEKVEVRKNQCEPLTKMDVLIVSDYTGPFVVTVSDVNADSQPWTVRSTTKTVTIGNLTPGTLYTLYAQTEFTDANNVKHLSLFTPGHPAESFSQI